ncbi:MAG: TerC/Alx family metal homeostasis membrane protein [Elusimicrobia bacterium]|nr:TerC/Alx family metal homeostasis membrane protein [Elusimicrobiota bacterium]
MTKLNIMWIIFGILTTILFFADLKLSSRAKEITQKESVILCLFWVSVAVLFGLLIGTMLGQQKMIEFYTGYLIEYTLSMDNMFVFLLIFSYFSIPKKYQPKILTWGIIGAVLMRFIFLFAGVKLLNAFHWLIYVFGAILILSAIKMAVQKEEGMDPSKNPLLKLIGKFIPIENTIKTGDFFTVKNKVLHATPLFAALIVIETSDIIFAVDSIPAILAVSRDTFVVYTSNVFAIVGLRALYFFLSSLIDYFRFLKLGISIILFYVGVKMLISDFYHITPLISLASIIFVLAVSMILSIIVKEKKINA